MSYKDKKIETVQDLINMLEEVEDKSLPIFLNHDTNILEIMDIDYCISDRVEINVKNLS